MNNGLEQLLREQDRQNAYVRSREKFHGSAIRRIPLTLTTARDDTNPMIFDGPFDAFYVETSSSSNSSVRLSLGSDNEALKNYIDTARKDSAEFSEPQPRVAMTWAAQSGVTVTIVLLYGVKFKPGSYLTQISGQVVPGFGTGMSPGAKVTMSGTATLIDAANSSALRRIVTNFTGATVYVSGTPAVTDPSGANPGIPVPAGSFIEWQNTGTIYGITSGAAATVNVNTES